MNIKLLKHQWDAINSNKKFTLLLGGIGSGKTFTGSAWILKKYIESPTGLGLITANTYGQLQKATLASVFRQLMEWSIPFSYNQQKSILTVNEKKQFLCLGLDSYDNHRGIEVSEWWGDEVAYNKREAFEVISGRLRDNRGKLDVLFTTTPRGMNWLYDYFHPSGENHDPNQYCVIKAKTTANKHLPEGYEKTLRTQYDDKLAQQELEGEFVNITAGKVYYAFDRKVNVRNVSKKAGTLYAGMDFNVDPMTCVVIQVTEDCLYVLDELFLRNSDTFQMAHELKTNGHGGASVIPDSTGRNRKTSGKSDFDILKEQGFKLIPTLNPLVFDRVNNVNRLLSQGRIIIDPKCKKLINDLEKVSWDGNKLDQKTDHLLTHISDALGYGAWKLMPIQTHKPQRISSLSK